MTRVTEWTVAKPASAAKDNAYSPAPVFPVPSDKAASTVNVKTFVAEASIARTDRHVAMSSVYQTNAIRRAAKLVRCVWAGNVATIRVG